MEVEKFATYFMTLKSPPLSSGQKFMIYPPAFLHTHTHRHTSHAHLYVQVHIAEYFTNCAHIADVELPLIYQPLILV